MLNSTLLETLKKQLDSSHNSIKWTLSMAGNKRLSLSHQTKIMSVMT